MDNQEHKSAPLHQVDIESIGLSRRAYRALARNGISSLAILCELDREDIDALIGVGPLLSYEIRETRKRYCAELDTENPAIVPNSTRGDTKTASRVIRAAIEKGNETTFFCSPALAKLDISVLRLSVRTHNALRRARIFRVGQLSRITSDDLRSIHGIGEETIREIRSKLELALSNPHVLVERLDPPNEFARTDKYDRQDPINVPNNLNLAGTSVSVNDHLGIHLPSSASLAPIEVLQLSVRSFNSLKRGGIHTIGQLSRMSVDDLRSIRNLGENSLAEIFQQLEQALPCAADDRASAGIILDSDPPRSPLPLRSPIEVLGVSQPVLRRLKEARIDSIETLLKTISLGNFYNIPDIGVVACTTILRSLAEIEKDHPILINHPPEMPLSTITSRLTPKTAETLTKNGFQIVGHLASWIPGSSFRPSLQLLHAIYEAKAKLALGQIEWEEPQDADAESRKLPGLRINQELIDSSFDELLSVLPERERKVFLGRRPKHDQNQTLEELGKEMEITRERTRQIEIKANRNLQNEFARVTSFHPLSRVSPNHIAAIEGFCGVVKGLKQDAILASDLHSKICRELDDSVDMENRSTMIFLELLGFEMIRFEQAGLEDIWIHQDAFAANNIKGLIINLHILLTGKNPSPMSELALQNELRLKPTDDSTDDLRMLIDLCPTIEECGVGIYRGKFEYLSRWVDQAERLLRERNEPLHFRQIAAEINRRIRPVREKRVYFRTLANALAADDRFEPIGRSGTWSLKEWGLESGTILDLMRECLQKERRPLTSDEIYRYVDDRRSVEKASVEMYLQFQETFVRVGVDRWALAEWPETQEMKTWDRLGVAEFLEELFTEAGSKSLEFSFLRQRLAEAASLRKKQAQGMLNHCPAIRIFTDAATNRTMAEFRPDFRKRISTSRRRKKKPTLLDLVSEEVHNILSDREGHSMPLRDLVDHLVSKMGKPRHTFYAYLSKLEFMEKNKDPKTGATICHLKVEDDQHD